METTVLMLVLLALGNASKIETSKSNEKKEYPGRSDKRELAEGNAAIGERALLPTALPTITTGIEYADTKEELADKTQNQQVYATPLPQIAKISDVLTGQGPPFQAAIASHLYSPVSVYQSRISSPTTYEIAPPVASQLAYSEHRVSVPNILQLNTKPRDTIKQNWINYVPSLPIQKSFQQIPSNPFFQPLQYSNPQVTQVQQAQQVPYQQIVGQTQPGVDDDRHQLNQKYQQVEQRDLKNQLPQIQLLEKQNTQILNPNPRNAFSYATFIYNPVDSADAQYLQQIPNPIQQQSQIQPQQSQELIQQQYPHQIDSQQVQIQTLPQIQYELQHPLRPQQEYRGDVRLEPEQVQYRQQIQPQRIVIQPQGIQRPQQYNIDVQPKTLQRQVIIKQEPIPQANWQPYHQHQTRNVGYSTISVPTFPPIQYFGKFAHSLFGGYQH